jgi:signal transduction histidine kinase
MAFSSGLKRLRDRLNPAASLALPGSAEQRQRSTAAALLAVSRAATGDWAESIRQIVELDAQAMGVERVTFWSARANPAGLRCQAGFIASLRMQERGTVLLEVDAPEYFAAMREAHPMVVRDVAADPRCRGLRDYCASRRITSLLNVPLRVRGELAGVLCHEHVGPARRWSARDEEIGAGAARIVEAALAAREHTQEKASARRAAFLDGVSRAVLQSLDRREIAVSALSFVVPQLADTAVLWALDRDGALQWLAARGARPESAAYLDAARRAGESRGFPVPALIVRQGHSLLLPEVHPSALDRYGVLEEFRVLARELEIRSTLGVPVAVAGRTLGALALFSADHRYGTADLELAESVAERIGGGLENARLYEVAREAIQARDDFLTVASGELRTPLTALRLLTDSSVQRAHRSGDAVAEERFRLVGIQAERLGRLVGRMLEAVKTRAEGVVLVPQACDLATVVGDCVRTARERAPASVDIRLAAAPGLTGRWDPAGLQRAIGELLDNAIRFAPTWPIEVHVRRAEDVAEVSVRDHGVGIPSDRVGSVFSPFERAAPAEHHGGLGLGLYLARTIVEAHGGSIALSSAVGEGTTVVVRLPIGAAAGVTTPR